MPAQTLLGISRLGFAEMVVEINVTAALHEQARTVTGDFRDNAAQHRFELDADGRTAVAYYALKSCVITMTHTEVPAEVSGRGIGSRLVHAALTDARARGLKVVPRCSFVSAYIARHPEFADLVL